MGASIKYNFGTGQKKGYTYVDNFGAGQENCGCKCTHCTHKFGALAYTKAFQISDNNWKITSQLLLAA